MTGTAAVPPGRRPGAAGSRTGPRAYRAGAPRERRDGRRRDRARRTAGPPWPGAPPGRTCRRARSAGDAAGARRGVTRLADVERVVAHPRRSRRAGHPTGRTRRPRRRRTVGPGRRRRRRSAPAARADRSVRARTGRAGPVGLSAADCRTGGAGQRARRGHRPGAVPRRSVRPARGTRGAGSRRGEARRAGPTTGAPLAGAGGRRGRWRRGRRAGGRAGAGADRARGRGSGVAGRGRRRWCAAVAPGRARCAVPPLGAVPASVLTSFSAAGNASRSLRTTGASMVEDGDLTNSPSSLSLAMISLLDLPSSLASSDAGLACHCSPWLRAGGGIRSDLVLVGRCSWCELHGVLTLGRPAFVCPRRLDGSAAVPLRDSRPGSELRRARGALGPCWCRAVREARRARPNARRRSAASRHPTSGCSHAPRPGSRCRGSGIDSPVHGDDAEQCVDRGSRARHPTQVRIGLSGGASSASSIGLLREADSRIVTGPTSESTAW